MKNIIFYSCKVFFAVLSLAAAWFLLGDAVEPYHYRQAFIWSSYYLIILFGSLLFIFSLPPKNKQLDLLIPPLLIMFISIIVGVDGIFADLAIFFFTAIVGYFFQKYAFRVENLKLYWLFAVAAITYQIIYTTAGEWMHVAGDIGLLIAAPSFFISIFVFPIFAISSPVYFFAIRKESCLHPISKKILLVTIFLLWILSISTTLPARSLFMRMFVDSCYEEYRYNEEITKEKPEFYVVGKNKCVVNGERNWFGNAIRVKSN